MLKENLKQVEENVLNACMRAGRKREEVTLIAVSKTKPVEMLQEIKVFEDHKIEITYRFSDELAELFHRLAEV